MLSAMDIEYNMYANLLKDAIIPLSLPAKEQVSLSRSGCLLCHLLRNTFFNYRDFIQYSPPDEINEKQRESLDNIIRFMNQMNLETDHQCFENQCLENKNWEELRRLAKVARLCFNW